jgi:hypothetical protein
VRGAPARPQSEEVGTVSVATDIVLGVVVLALLI